jgi:hypothetical protein
MGWQAPQYIYPKIEQPDVAGTVSKLTEAGTKLGQNIGMAISAVKQASFDTKIGNIASEAQTKIDALTPATTGETATADKALAMSGQVPVTDSTATQQTAQTDPDIQAKRMKINADMHNKIIQTYYEYGKVKEAQGLEDKFFDQTLKVAAIDHKTGEKIWNNSFLKDKYGEVNLTPKDKFKVVGDHGTYIRVNESTGEVTPIQSVGEMKSFSPDDNVYVKTTDKDGKVTWNQVQIAKPDKAQTQLIGGQLYERGADGTWKKVAENSQKTGTTAASSKTSQQTFDDLFVQNYGGAFVDETGKAPDKNTVLAKMGKSVVEGKVDRITGKPITLQQLHDSMQQYYSQQIKDGVEPAEALNNTTIFGKSFGTQNKKGTVDGSNSPAFDLKMTPKQQSDLESGNAIQQQNPKTGEVSLKYADGSKVVLIAGKGGGGAPEKTPAKKTEKTPTKPAATVKPTAAKTTKPAETETPKAAAPAAKAAEEKPKMSQYEKDLEEAKKQDSDGVAAASVKKRLEKKQERLKNEEKELSDLTNLWMKYGLSKEAAKAKAEKTVKGEYDKLRKEIAAYTKK